MPLTIGVSRTAPSIDRSRLADQMLALLGDDRAVEHAAESLTRSGGPSASPAVSPGIPTGIPINYCTIETIKNIFSVFSGYFINFDYGPKSVKKAYEALRNTSEKVALNTAFQIVMQQPCFIEPDKDLFCAMVKNGARFRDGE